MTEELFPAMPIIVGVARSGTTLLRLMLGAHREISIPRKSATTNEERFAFVGVARPLLAALGYET
jgi:hypothetical protein